MLLRKNVNRKDVGKDSPVQNEANWLVAMLSKEL